MPSGRVAVFVWAYVAVALAALITTTLFVPVSAAIATPFTIGDIPPAATGIAFWIALTVMGSAWSQREEGRAAVVLATAPIIAAIVLGGPTAAAWVALLGTVELRELHHGVPWYGTLTNHALVVVPAALGGLASAAIGGDQLDLPATALEAAIAAAIFGSSNAAMALALLWARTGRHPAQALGMPWTGLGSLMVAESALAWLGSLTYHLVWWSPVALVVANASSLASVSASQSNWLLRHHQLTDLPNARSLNEHAAEMRRTDQSGLCVFYIDLDGFKAINDRHGHHVGDDVLREVGTRLRASTRSEDFLAHLHGDEFVLLAQGVRSDAEAQRVIERLQGSLACPIEHEVGTISVAASVGYRLAAEAGALEQALREADLNMAATKAARAVASGRMRRAAPSVITTTQDRQSH